LHLPVLVLVLVHGPVLVLAPLQARRCAVVWQCAAVSVPQNLAASCLLGARLKK
jgi:hypothetical protein